MQADAPCPDCSGRGTVAAFVDTETGGHFDLALRCLGCGGTGHVPVERIEWRKQGRAHREARVARDESLMECARRMGITPAVLSAMSAGAPIRPRSGPGWHRRAGAMVEPYADLVKALAEAEGRLARMGRVISILMAPPPSTKGMDPKARAQRLHAEWERRVKKAKEAADGG